MNNTEPTPKPSWWKTNIRPAIRLIGRNKRWLIACTITIVLFVTIYNFIDSYILQPIDNFGNTYIELWKQCVLISLVFIVLTIIARYKIIKESKLKESKQIYYLLLTILSIYLYIRFQNKFYFIQINDRFVLQDILIIPACLMLYRLWLEFSFSYNNEKSSTVIGFSFEDIEAKEDKIGIEPLTNVLLNTFQYNVEQTFVIGITGNWGYGKSSFVHLLLKKVNNDDFITFNFNPWEFKAQSNIEERFFDGFSEQLKNYDKNLVDYISTYLHSATKDSKFGINEIVSKLSPKKDLDQIVKSINRINKRILIVIDDLDRLDRDEFLNVMKLVRNIKCLNNTYILLCYDKHRLLSHFQESDKDYIEKIVNYELQLPRHDKLLYYKKILVDSLTSIVMNVDGAVGVEDEEAISKEMSSFITIHEVGNNEYNNRKYIDSNFEQIIKTDRFDSFKIYNLFDTPRDLKRFLSAFYIAYGYNSSNVYFLDYFLIHILKWKHKDDFNKFFFSGEDNLYQLEMFMRPNYWDDIIKEGKFNLDFINILRFLYNDNRKVNKRVSLLYNDRVYLYDFYEEKELTANQFIEVLNEPAEIEPQNIFALKDKLNNTDSVGYSPNQKLKWLLLINKHFDFRDYDNGGFRKINLIINTLTELELTSLIQNLATDEKKKPTDVFILLTIHAKVADESLKSQIIKICIETVRATDSYETLFPYLLDEILVHHSLFQFLQLALTKDISNMKRLYNFRLEDEIFYIIPYDAVRNLSAYQVDAIRDIFLVQDPIAYTALQDWNFTSDLHINLRHVSISSEDYDQPFFRSNGNPFLPIKHTLIRRVQDNNVSENLFFGHNKVISNIAANYSEYEADRGGTYTFEIDKLLDSNIRYLKYAAVQFQVEDSLQLTLNGNRVELPIIPSTLPYQTEIDLNLFKKGNNVFKFEIIHDGFKNGTVKDKWSHTYGIIFILRLGFKADEARNNFAKYLN